MGKDRHHKNKISSSHEAGYKLTQLLSQNEYKETIGQWLLDAYEECLYNMTNATELHDFHRCQGAYNALKKLKDRTDASILAYQIYQEKNGGKHE